MLKLRTKIEVMLVSLLLIIISISAIIANQRFGTDASGQQWFGPVGDEITTSTGKSFPVTEAGLKAAIWGLNATDGGTVYLPSATIQCNTPIYIGNNTNIVGCGNRTVIENINDYSVTGGIFNFDINSSSPDAWKHDITIRDISFSTSVRGRVPIRISRGERVTVENVNIYGGGTSTTIFHDGIYVGAVEQSTKIRARNCTIRNMKCYNMSYFGAEFAGAEYCTISDSKFSKNGQHGFVLSGGKNCTISNCISEQNGQDGFSVGDCYNTIFIGCIAAENGRIGYNFHQFHPTMIDSLIVSGCNANSNADSGFEFSWVKNSLLDGCISNSDHYGITIDNSDNLTFSDFIANNSNAQGIQDQTPNTCENITFANCKFIGAAGYGADLYVKDYVLKDCIFKRNALWGLRVRNANRITIDGCEFLENSQHGCRMDSVSLYGIVRDCTFYNNDQGGGSDWTGLNLTNCKNVTVKDCLFEDTRTVVGGNMQKFGVVEYGTAATSNNNFVWGCVFLGLHDAFRIVSGHSDDMMNLVNGTYVP